MCNIGAQNWNRQHVFLFNEFPSLDFPVRVPARYFIFLFTYIGNTFEVQDNEIRVPLVLAYLPYFLKMEICDYHAACVSVSSPICF
jgi:hypothetical protein